MHKLLFALFVIVTLIGFPTRSLAQQRFDPNDPLLVTTNSIILASYDKGTEGVKPYVRSGDTPEDKARLALIYKFADDCKASADQQRLRPQTLNVVTGFLARRLSDKEGKPLDIMQLRVDVPPLLGITTTDGKVATLIIWTLKFIREGDTYRLDSITREHLASPGHTAGANSVTIGTCKEKGSYVISFSAPKTL